jgi:hypothetical protein
MNPEDINITLVLNENITESHEDALWLRLIELLEISPLGATKDDV